VLRALRQPRDARAYELLPVSSIEEAVVVVRCNAYVEACLIGDRAPLYAEPTTGMLSKEERRVLETVATGDTPPVKWLAGWLRAGQPALTVASLDLPVGDLHRLLVTH
jgi:hypothetical protein